MRRTASATPGCSTRNVWGSSIACTRTSVAARTVAVAGWPSTTDISPKTAPGASTRANAVPSRSRVTSPSTSTSSRSGLAPSSIRTPPAGVDTTGRAAQSTKRAVTPPFWRVASLHYLGEVVHPRVARVGEELVRLRGVHAVGHLHRPEHQRGDGAHDEVGDQRQEARVDRPGGVQPELGEREGRASEVLLGDRDGAVRVEHLLLDLERRP